jgi:hypothetical protein
MELRCLLSTHGSAACQGHKGGWVSYNVLIVGDSALIRHALRSSIEQTKRLASVWRGRERQGRG